MKIESWQIGAIIGLIIGIIASIINFEFVAILQISSILLILIFVIMGAVIGNMNR